MEHRKYPRVTVDTLMADISDGKGFFIGMIDNVSRFGLQISDLSKQLDSTTEILTGIINGQGENFKMFLKPRWEVANGQKKRVGFEIESCSWGWTDYVMGLETKTNEGGHSSTTVQ